MFPEDLIAAYPSAKVILSIREEDGWYASVERTIWHSWIQDKARSYDGTVANPLESLADKFHQHLWKSNFEAHGRQQFREHNEHVKTLLSHRAAEDLLIYNVQEGWEPLCRFLGKEVPLQGFPRNDDWAQYKIHHAQGSES